MIIQIIRLNLIEFGNQKEMMELRNLEIHQKYSSEKYLNKELNIVDWVNLMNCKKKVLYQTDQVDI